MSFLRISGGSLRGRRIPVPPHDLRPTSERARQAYFNIVAPQLKSSAFLDLFAGSGIFSFEAVSRGASRAVAIDASRKAAEEISRRAAEWTVPIRAVASDVFPALRRLGPEPFDLVYADPPYDFGRHAELLDLMDTALPLSPGAVVAVEHRRGASPGDDHPCVRLELRKTVEYGSVAITLFDAK